LPFYVNIILKNNLINGGGVMKNNVIWVDFTAKNKKRGKYKKFISNIIKMFMNFLSKSKKKSKPQNKNKSIL